MGQNREEGKKKLLILFPQEVETFVGKKHASHPQSQLPKHKAYENKKVMITRE